MSDWDLFMVYFTRSVDWSNRERYLRTKNVLVHLVAGYPYVIEAYTHCVNRLRSELNAASAGRVPR